MAEAQTLNPARIEQARLAANLSQTDLAFEIRRVSSGRLKPTEKNVRSWIQGKHLPREGVVPAIAAATGHEIAFFYEQDGDDEDEEAELLRDLQQLPGDLRLRVERALRRARSEA